MKIQSITELFSQHKKIALQCSGGKDSLACLYILRDHWDDLTVYFLNSGDAFPETLEVMKRVKLEVPHYVEVAGRVKHVNSAFGIPSDIVPATSTRLARVIDIHADPLAITDRYTCCSESIMYPLQQRMYDDEITLIIRGQKATDLHKPFLRSGDKIDQFSFLFPIESWTDKQVLQYLKDAGIQLSRLYDELNTSGGCLTCSAWWHEGRGAYLAKHHPSAYKLYQIRLARITAAIEPHAVNFSKEMIYVD